MILIFRAWVREFEDLEIQALWEYVYGSSGIGPGAPWDPAGPKIQLFLSQGVSGALFCSFPILATDPFLGPMPPMDPILLCGPVFGFLSPTSTRTLPWRSVPGPPNPQNPWPNLYRTYILVFFEYFGTRWRRRRPPPWVSHPPSSPSHPGKKHGVRPRILT